jgi:transcriptional regulator with XRE-family HTH domain
MWNMWNAFHMSTTDGRREANAGVGEQIRIWRNHFRLTQIELEERAGLAHNAVSRIENQDVSPRLETVESLAIALGLSVERLQFSRPKFGAVLKRRRVDPGDPASIIQRLTSLSAEKSVRAIEVIHRILDLME